MRTNLLNRINNATQRIMPFIQAQKGRKYGIHLEGGINRMAKNICIRQYFQKALDYAQSTKTKKFDDMTDNQLSEFCQKVENVVFFINRPEENFVDFYKSLHDCNYYSAPPGDNIGLILNNGEKISIRFNDVEMVEF